MDGTAAAGSTPHKAANARATGAGQAFLGDARLAATALNHGRRLALTRVVRGPFSPSRADAGTGGILIREAVLGMAGPAEGSPRRHDLDVAMLGAFVPGVRRTAHGIREAELRVRRRRMSVYTAARDRGDAA